MSKCITRSALIVLLGLAGCGGNDEIQLIGPQPLKLTEEQAASIRLADKLVDEEEGGSAKITRPTKSVSARPRPNRSGE